MMNNQEIIAKLDAAGFHFFSDAIEDILDKFVSLNVKCRYDANVRYDWNDPYESVWTLTNDDGQEYEESWSGDQYYINDGLVALTELDYYKAADACGANKDDADSLLASWKQFHDAETEGYPICLYSVYRADIENEDGEEKTIEDPQCTVDGTGRFNLI